MLESASVRPTGQAKEFKLWTRPVANREDSIDSAGWISKWVNLVSPARFRTVLTKDTWRCGLWRY